MTRPMTIAALLASALAAAPAAAQPGAGARGDWQERARQGQVQASPPQADRRPDADGGAGGWRDRDGRPAPAGAAWNGPGGWANDGRAHDWRARDGRSTPVGASPDDGPPPAGRRFEGRTDHDVTVWRGGPGGDNRPGYGRPDAPPQYRDDRGRPGGPPPQWAGRGDPRGPGVRGADRGPDGRWDRGWRDDRRYDWQGWRATHRAAYRVGRYAAPPGFGYGYRPVGIGAPIAPAFFARSYWIGDPGYYRLPPAYGPYRWVRYYGDALLVDVRFGRVVDAIPAFFG